MYVNVRKYLMRPVGIISGVFFQVMLITSPVFSEPTQLEPLRGTFAVPVRINDTKSIPFIVDSGAASLVIPKDVFRTLIQAGTVHQKDFIETVPIILADGSERSGDKFRLHKVIVGDHVIRDVVATVLSVDKGDPLLGQSFLSKLPAWTIDNKRHVLVLHDKSQTPDAPPTTGGGKVQSALVSQETTPNAHVHIAQNFRDPGAADLCPPPRYHMTPADGCQAVGRPK
jgi:clan AA aspartic protease (TIGR02281 family)